MEGMEILKLLIVLDSIGMMSSNKRKRGPLKGDIKTRYDETKQLNYV